MKFTITNPDNTTVTFEISCGPVKDMLLVDETNKVQVCKIWRQLIECEKEYRKPFGLEYPTDYNEDQPIIDHMVKTKEKCYFLKTEQGNLIGIGFTSKTNFKNTYYISDVVVDSEFRGKGLGRKLVEFIMEDNIPGVPTLGVDVNNSHAVDMYRSLGFVEYGLRMVLGTTEQK